MIFRSHNGVLIDINLENYVSDLEIYKLILFLKFGKNLDENEYQLDKIIKYINE